MSLARAECGMGNDFLSEATDNHLLLCPCYYFLIIASYSQKRNTFGLELEVLRSCRDGFYKFHFPLQKVLGLFLSEEKMILCLTISGEEIKPYIVYTQKCAFGIDG